MSIQNTIALLEMYSHRNVAAVRTPSGIVFMGARNLKPNEKKTLLAIPQSELDAAIRWQK
ncbi:hypothetical protein BV494_04690 [Rahnella sikkimica]|uniref:Uncharacterized protein n=1 Tax=Rahnella sikkimica TaxID=1805933 RepID=A0A2L1UMV7_9GAMM|nr:hypothetical protein BV494_04690 [Rahnella sikkimica]